MRLPLPQCLLMLFAVLGAGSARAQTSPIEHVVVVLLDDVGVDKIAAYGEHPTAGPTPAIDSLARGGLLFRNAYANPTCSTTRCAALTGLYGSRTGVDTGIGTFDVSDDLPWLPRLLGAEGIRSYACGKWHLADVTTDACHQHPIRVGFTWHRGHLSNLNGDSPFSWPKNIATAASWSEVTTTTYVTTDNVIEAWNALHESEGQRSFVWLAFNVPHPPWDILPPPALYTPVGGSLSQAKKQQYALQALDTLLGNLMAFYREQLPDDAARTLWLVMGDNGTPAAAVEPPWPAYEHKSEVFEGGVHVPLIAFGAGVDQPGRETEQFVHAVDLHATLLELFGARPMRKRDTDSLSFAPIILDATATAERQTIYVRHAEPNGFGPKTWREHAARIGRWKLIERQGVGAALYPARQLFDLSVDPLEQHNLWPPNTPEEEAIVDELKAVLAAGSAPHP